MTPETKKALEAGRAAGAVKEAVSEIRQIHALLHDGTIEVDPRLLQKLQLLLKRIPELTDVCAYLEIEEGAAKALVSNAN